MISAVIIGHTDIHTPITDKKNRPNDTKNYFRFRPFDRSFFSKSLVGIIAQS